MTDLFQALVNGAKSLRKVNHQYIGMINDHTSHQKDVARWKYYMSNNFKEARFYLKLAKAEKEFQKNGK